MWKLLYDIIYMWKWIRKISSKCLIIKLDSINKKFFDFNLNTKSKIEMFCGGYRQIADFLK